VTTKVDNPFKPGQSIDVIDTKQLPQSFVDEKPLFNREFTYTVGAYGFYRIGGTRPTDRALTFIPALTYKRAFTKPDEIQICPVALPGAPLQTTEQCRSAFASKGKIAKSLIPSLETRFHLPNRLLAPWLIPSFGFAPKVSFEDDLDGDRRYGFEMPIWFSLNSDGALNGGIAFARQWGGRGADGPRDPESSLSLFFGTTFDLGSK
jgi:hypothetical protein